MKTFGIILSIIMVMGVSFILPGTTFYLLWDWLILPALPMLPILAWTTCVSISFIIRFIIVGNTQYKAIKNNDLDESLEIMMHQFWYTLVLNVMAIGIGYAWSFAI